MTEVPRSDTEVLIAELAADGATPDPGRFTVDPARARELLASFRLADPASWAAELIQSATLLGATRLDASVTCDRVEIAFDGEPFTREELELADSALLSRVETPRQRAVAQLAAALAGASAMAPREIRVTSGGQELIRRPGEPDRIAPRDPAAPTTRVVVERRTGRDDDLPEAGALASLGRYSDLEIHVNGGRDSWGMTLRGAALVAPFGGDGFTGVAQISASADSPGLVIQQHGLQIARERLASERDHLLVVVDAPGAERDLGLGRFREGPLLETIRQAAREAGDRILVTAAAELERRPDPEGQEVLRQTLRSACRGAQPPPGLDVGRLRLWPVLSGQPGPRHLSLDDLVGSAGPKPHLRFTTLSAEDLELEVLECLGPGDRVLQVSDSREAQTLARWRAVPAVDLDDRLRSRRPTRGEAIRRVIVPMGWLCLLLPFALGSVHLGRGCYHDRLAQRSWPTVQAERVRAEVERLSDDDGVSYVVTAELRYQVKGKTYRTKIIIDSFRFESRARRKLGEVLHQDRWPLRIDPRRPDQVLQKPERLWVPVVVFGLLPALLVVGLIGAAIGGVREVQFLRQHLGEAQRRRLREHLAALDAGRIA